MVEEVDSTPATETAAIVPMPAAERVVVSTVVIWTPQHPGACRRT